MKKSTEIATLVIVFVLLIAVVIVLLPKAGREQRKTDCLENLKSLSSIMQGSALGQLPGPSEVYSLAFALQRGQWDDEKAAKLFCPGDEKEEPQPATAYRGIDLGSKGHGHLTSYAWRDGRLPKCAKVEAGGAFLADDSLDHHGNGVNVAYIGGPVRWRELDGDVSFGDQPALAELRCLRAD